MDQLPTPLVSSMETANLNSLYVGDLDATVTEAQLTDFFSGMNGFVSAVLCKDNNTGQSLRHGFVDFADLESARVAIAARNNTLMNGKAIRVMWRHDEYKTNEDANLFVKNLDSSIDNMKLQAIFAKYGNILSCKVQVFDNGNSKGYGYVQFETPESAQKAIEELNGHDVEGKKIYVDHFKKKEDRIQSDVGYTNLYVKNLKQSVTEETLQEKFSVFGNITSLVISRDSNGVSKGFGFVNFERPEDAKKAEESMNGAQLESKVLYVAKALKKQERQHMLQGQLQGMSQEEQIQQNKGFNVYVKHINDDVDEDQLKEFFNICGMVKSVKIMRNDNGISRGFGFVCFSKPEEAERAIRILNGIMFHRKPLHVSMAQTKEERSTFCQLAHRQRTMGGIPRPFNTSITPTYPIFGYPPFPMVSAQIPGFASQHGERMNGHMIAHNRNHPFQHSYPQRATSANNMRNRWNNERVVRVPTASAAFSAFNPVGF